MREAANMPEHRMKRTEKRDDATAKKKAVCFKNEE
jgi:hypothetical protein